MASLGTEDSKDKEVEDLSSSVYGFSDKLDDVISYVALTGMLIEFFLLFILEIIKLLNN